MRARDVPPILAAPWNCPAVIRLTRDERALEWTPRPTRRVSADGRELADLLDQFTKLGRRPAAAAGRWVPDALLSFSRRWGPWGACERHDAGHDELSVAMTPRPELPKPRNYKPPTWSRQPVQVTLESARRVNALRILIARLRLGETPDRDALRTLLSYDSRLSADSDVINHDAGLESDGRPARIDGLIAAGATAVQEEIDRLVETWATAVHVGPAAWGWAEGARPIYMKVGGVAGALAVAVLAERTGRLRIAICNVCGAARSVWKGWDELMVTVGEACRTCKGAGYATTWRNKPREQRP